ncbi:MAG: hypothetical protein HXX16_00865 [Bacteroidales bacterium]|nr:hypothetical protein [Bacteroidales bacterium]
MGAGNSIDYNRLMALNQKVKNSSASNAERDELMSLLYRNNSITKKQYDDYIAGRNIDEILKTSLVIAGIVLLGYLLSKLVSK